MPGRTTHRSCGAGALRAWRGLLTSCPVKPDVHSQVSGLLSPPSPDHPALPSPPAQLAAASGGRQHSPGRPGSRWAGLAAGYLAHDLPAIEHDLVPLPEPVLWGGLHMSCRGVEDMERPEGTTRAARPALLCHTARGKGTQCPRAVTDGSEGTGAGGSSPHGSLLEHSGSVGAMGLTLTWTGQHRPELDPTTQSCSLNQFTHGSG